MKKILEILQYGDHDIRFNTDFKPSRHPNQIPDLISSLSFAMNTTLWGGNELDILGVARALAIADLAVSVNRKEMIRYLDEASEMMAHAMAEAKEMFEKSGGKVYSFAPGINPTKAKS